MPELPEVETIVRDLNHELKGKTIISAESSDKKVFQLSKADLKNVIGKKIKSVGRRAKMLIFDLGNYKVLIHLKMTGQLVYRSPREIIAGGHPIQNEGKTLPNKFTRAIIRFNDKSVLYFNDVRRFGWIKLAGSAELDDLEKKLGIEPLSSAFKLEYFKAVLAKRKNATIKQALMEQKYIAGIGNIYADEALFAARIKPFRRIKTLTAAEVKKLFGVIPKILRFAIKHRGTSFNDYVDAKGEVGNFLKYLKVYGRAGEKCPVCGGMVKKTKLGGRGTHWCPSCQK